MRAAAGGAGCESCAAKHNDILTRKQTMHTLISEKEAMSDSGRISDKPVNDGDRIRLTTLTDKGG